MALSNSPVHPPIGQDTLTIDLPHGIGSEEDAGLTDFFEGRWALSRDGFPRAVDKIAWRTAFIGISLAEGTPIKEGRINLE